MIYLVHLTSITLPGGIRSKNRLKALIMASPTLVKAASSRQSHLSSKAEAMVSSLTRPRTCRFPPLRNPIVVLEARNLHLKAISALTDLLAVKAKPASLRPTWKTQGPLSPLLKPPCNSNAFNQVKDANKFLSMAASCSSVAFLSCCPFLFAFCFWHILLTLFSVPLSVEELSVT